MAGLRLALGLAGGRPGTRRHPLVVIVPSLSIIVLVYNIYLLGQPNLLLLALLLGAFACLRLGRQVAAGALVATAAAIKAFPILVLGYLVYRRMWTASAATVAVLAAWLLIAPLPFRTPAQAVDDLVVWSRGCSSPTTPTGSPSARSGRTATRTSRSWPCASPAARRAGRWRVGPVERARGYTGRAATKGAAAHRPVDRSPDLPEAACPASRSSARPRGGEVSLAIAPVVSAGNGARAAERPRRWDDAPGGAESALRTAWRVNLVDWSFRSVTAITTWRRSLALSLFVVAVLPRRARRTRETDALEFALVTLLDRDVFAALVQLRLCLADLSRDTGPAPRLERAGRGTVAPSQARLDHHRLLVSRAGLAHAPACAGVWKPVFTGAFLVFGLGMLLWSEGRRQPEQAGAALSRFAHRDHLGECFRDDALPAGVV